MNWSGNFREGLAREIRENKTLAKITAYTVSHSPFPSWILTIHYMLPELGWHKWDGFNSGISTINCPDTQQYTPLISVLSWNLYIGLVFDQILKANFKINEKLWNNAHKSCNKTIPNKIVHYSAMYCVNLSRITLRLFELFTIKSVKHCLFFNT